MTFIIEKNLIIDAPAEIVWEVISDFARYPEWNPFCVECSSTMQPGDPIDLKVKLMARPQAQREWVTELVPGSRFVYSMKPVPGGALSSMRSHDLRPLDAMRTEYRSYFHLKGWMRFVVLGLFKARLEAGFEGMSEGIRQRAESLWAQRQGAAR